MGKKRKTRKQKLLAQQRRRQATIQQGKTFVTADHPTLISFEKVENATEGSIYAYPVNLIKKDLIRSLGLALAATLILGLFYYFLP